MGKKEGPPGGGGLNKGESVEARGKEIRDPQPMTEWPVRTLGDDGGVQGSMPVRMRFSFWDRAVREEHIQ